MKNLQKEFVGGCTPDSLNSRDLFPAEIQIQVLWTPALSGFCFVLSLCPITQFFSATAAVLLLGSVTRPLPALLLPLLVKPFHALIPDVLSKVMNHTCTSESLLTNEAYAPNSAVH